MLGGRAEFASAAETEKHRLQPVTTKHNCRSEHNCGREEFIMLMLRRGKAIAGCLLVVSHQQILAGERGWIPGLALKSGKALQLAGFLRIGVQQNDLARFGGDEQDIPDQDFLAVAVVAVLPSTLTA